MKNESVGLYAATWKLQGVRHEAELDQIVKALHNAPGILGCEVTMDTLEVTYDPDQFAEAKLRAFLANVGRFEILNRLATIRRVLPTRNRELAKS